MPPSQSNPAHHRVPVEVETSSEDSSGGGGGRRAGEGPSDPKISLSIKGQDGEVMHFVASYNKPIKMVLITYCQEKLYDLKIMRFFIGNRDFDYRKTPAQLGLKDNQLIVAVMPHHGG